MLPKKSCLLNYNLSLPFRNKAVYNEILAHTVVLFENMHFYCTYSIINENIFNFGYWVLSENRKKLIPSKKNQSVLIAKISSRKTQKIANPQKINSRKNFLLHGIYCWPVT